MTTFEYDEQGRVTRSVTVREPEWTAADVSLLLASKHLEHRDSTGQLLTEATDLGANPANPDGTHYYVAGVPYAKGGRGPVINWAERAVAEARKNYRERYPDEDMAGLYFPVERIDRVPRT